MPGKSRQRRGKRFSQSRKRKAGLSQPATVARQSAISQTPESVSRPTVPVSSASRSSPTVKPTAAPYHSITTELRTIGILAGVMLIILIVLALVLPRYGL